MRVMAVLLFILAALGLARPAQAVEVRVDLSTQTMHVTSKSGESYVWPVSSGRAGYNTPRGVYRAQRLARMHYSRKYDNAPMPHSIFFRGGYAIHATNAVKRLGSPASHGCVRLAPGNAAKLYSMVQQEGARISITGAPPHQTMIAAAPHKRAVASAAKKKKTYAYARARTKAKSHHLAARRAPSFQPLGFAPLRGGYDPSMRMWLQRPTGR
jgi:hypothetical protein